MKSIDSIKSELVAIANDKGYTGEIVEVATSLLAYTLYHNQIEIANAVQESNLVTAKLMPSKITQCMKNMYSVYRGKNAKVNLSFISNTILDYNKFDLMYSSNTFKVYAAKAYHIGVEGTEDDPVVVEGIISCKDKIVTEINVTERNKYYIDAIDSQGHLLSELSEDIRVFIDNTGTGDHYVEYPTTRRFNEHVSSNLVDENAADDLDTIFVLTTPDYGVRLFKKGFLDENGNQVGYFKVNSLVKIECMTYTTDDQVNPDEFNKILLKGTKLVNRELIPDVSREDSSSILYNANSVQRSTKEIRSNSDIATLFTEYFIDYILYSDLRFNQEGQVQTRNGAQLSQNMLYIFYIPRDDEFSLDNIEVAGWIDTYRNYLITESIEAYAGVKVMVPIQMKIQLSDTNEISDEITEILNGYSSELTVRSPYSESQMEADANLDWDYDYYSELVDINELRSKIAKISNVVAISEMIIDKQIPFINGTQVDSLDVVNNRLITSYYDPNNLVRVPVYYQLVPQIKYTYQYESVSK